MSDERENRNAVFSQPSVSVSLAEKIKADFDFEIPTETVPLPSAGLVYPKDSSLHGSRTVDITCMSAKQENILNSRALIKKGTVVTELIKSCLIDKTINVHDLLLGDRNALMVSIRATGYGADYKAKHQCSDCEVTSEVVFDLSAIEIKPLNLAPVTPGQNLFLFTLPKSKKNVKFRFLTGRDEEEMNATAEKQKKLGISSDTNVTTTLFYSIVAINDVDDKAKIANFIQVMPAIDSKELRSYIKKNEPGINMKQEITCEACGHVESVGIELTQEFFWPGLAD